MIEEIYNKGIDPYNKQSAAIGAAILGNTDIELKYVQYLLDDEEANLRDRSFTMVYYQDVIYGLFKSVIK